MKHANIAIFVPHAGCPNQCSFCNQRTISGQQQAPSGEEAAALCREALKQRGKAAQNTEIAFFGGSFTAIDRDYMLELLQAVQPFLGKDGLAGIRISTRPDAIDHTVLRMLQDFGVTAIELGVQSMDNRILNLNHRGHTVEDVEQAVALIRQYPFELGLQFMPGLYGDSKESMWATAKAIAALRPDTVRIYPTLVLKGTELACLYQKGLYKPLELEEAVELAASFLDLFEKQGIRVIRMGLHAALSVEKELLAGPYHPAFRELCESRLYYRQALSELEHREQSAKYHLFVRPSDLSKMVGQNRENLQKLKNQGYNIKVKPLPGMEARQFVIQTVEEEGRETECS